MLQLAWLNAGAVVFNLEPTALQLLATADFYPTVAVAGGVHHHIHHGAFDRQRMHIDQHFAGD